MNQNNRAQPARTCPSNFVSCSRERFLDLQTRSSSSHLTDQSIRQQACLKVDFAKPWRLGPRIVSVQFCVKIHTSESGNMWMFTLLSDIKFSDFLHHHLYISQRHSRPTCRRGAALFCTAATSGVRLLSLRLLYLVRSSFHNWSPRPSHIWRNLL